MRLELREVNAKDMDLLFEWANDPVTRQNAFHTEAIPYETHRNWFIKTLADRDVLIYILCADKAGKEDPLGQIRLAIEGEEALISYSIDVQRRGQGLGTKMILMAEEKLRESRADVSYCKGQVKLENIASAKVFDKCGYDLEEKDNFLEFTKRIRG